MISEVCAANGSRTAVEQSGTSTMSDSLIAFHPAIDEPSNMTPSLRKSSVIVSCMVGEMLPLATRIGEPEIDVLNIVLLHYVHDFLSVRHCQFLFKDC